MNKEIYERFDNKLKIIEHLSNTFFENNKTKFDIEVGKLDVFIDTIYMFDKEIYKKLVKEKIDRLATAKENIIKNQIKHLKQRLIFLEDKL